MNNLIKGIIIVGIIASIQIVNAVPTENEYGSVIASFNGQEATVKNVKLKIGEPCDIKVTVYSNISGHVIIKLTNPLVIEPYEVLEGINIGTRNDNLNILPGWSKTIIWKLKPNGEWKNGNAPLNIFVQFTKIENDKIKGEKKIEFTIANPYILDEQYTGSATTTISAREITGAGTPAKPEPFPSVIFVFMALLMARRFIKRA